MISDSLTRKFSIPNQNKSENLFCARSFVEIDPLDAKRVARGVSPNDLELRCQTLFNERGENGKWLGLRATIPQKIEKELEYIFSSEGNQLRSVSPAGYLQSFNELPGFLVEIDEGNIAKCLCPDENRAIPCIFTNIYTGFGERKMVTLQGGTACIQLKLFPSNLRFSSLVKFKEHRDEYFDELGNDYPLNERVWTSPNIGGDEVILETILEETVCGIFYQTFNVRDTDKIFGLAGALLIQEAFYHKSGTILPIFCYGVETLEKTEHVFDQILQNVI